MHNPYKIGYHIMRYEGGKWHESFGDYDPWPLLIPTCKRWNSLGITCYVESPEGRCIYPEPK